MLKRFCRWILQGELLDEYLRVGGMVLTNNAWTPTHANIINKRGEMGMKVKVRLQGTKAEVEKLRKHFLKKHPQMIMSKPREGTNPKYAGNQKWACYGDYQFGVVRKRRG